MVVTQGTSVQVVKIAEGVVKSHSRSTGWEDLAKKVVDHVIEKREKNKNTLFMKIFDHLRISNRGGIMNCLVIGIIALMLGILIGVFVMALFSASAYQKGRDDLIGEMRFLGSNYIRDVLNSYRES